MKIHQLNALIALVDEGSIRGAARVLGLTQPALGARIAELEQDLGATLVNRTARGTTLTAAGRALLVHARTITNHIRRAEAEMAQINSRAVASIAIGASPLAATELVGPIFTSLQSNVIGVHLSVTEGQFHDLASYLREGGLEFILAQIPPGGKDTRAFHFEELIAYPLRVVGRKNHPLADCRHLTDLTGSAWIVGAATSKNRSTVEELFLEHSLPPPRIDMHCDAITCVQASIAESNLLGLLVPPLYEHLPDRIAALPIEDRIRPLRLGLITLAGVPLSPEAQILTELIRERSRKLANVSAAKRRRGTPGTP
ncbi:LysR family transcriptional regulator [Paraburkholderia caffeinilytica]|uniref:LysR family transcriptional regulator n=1 Tax=Paraburkholderia caffeinilytica TaxID=1761016 RepID=UPI0038B79120